MRIGGIAASPGMAFGPAVIRREAQPDSPYQAAGCREHELARLKTAVTAAKEQLAGIAESARCKAGEEAASIIKSQMAMLDDPMLMRPIAKSIEQGGLSAEQAVDCAIRQLAAQLSAIEDKYLRERAADVEDVGRRLIDNLTGRRKPEPVAGILIASDVSPSEAVLLDPQQVMAIATEQGGATSHAAILARALNIPAVVGATGMLDCIRTGDMVLVDGDAGEVLIHPDAAIQDECRRKQASRRAVQRALQNGENLAAVTLDGFRVELAANVGSLREVGQAVSAGAEGIGLFRTEFLYLNAESPPSEEEQYALYKQALLQMAPYRVVIRTIDFGSDKQPVSGKAHATSNPALGLRGIRFALEHRALFLTQLRALARASAFGKLGILLPMVSTLAEVRQTKQLLRQVAQAEDQWQLGVMIETPAAALQAEELAAEVDFFSIGTNDLTQYVLAVDRMDREVAHLYDSFHPAVLRLVQSVCAAARRNGKWVGVCGEMAADVLAIPLLLGMGMNELSMRPASIPDARTCIRQLTGAEAATLAGEVIALGSAGEVRSRLKAFLEKNHGKCSPNR